VPRNVRSDLALLVRFWRTHSGTTIRWSAGTRADGTPATVLELHDTLPRPPFRQPGHHLTITSRPQRLNGAFFETEATKKINDVAAKGHGRTLTCLDKHGDPLAAIAYHLHGDPTAPLLITGIAILKPNAVSARLRSHSEAAAGILLTYLARAAMTRGAPARLGLGSGQTTLTALLGFAPSAPPSAYSSATQYLEWRPPVR
jgi:hypothetical protein